MAETCLKRKNILTAEPSNVDAEIYLSFISDYWNLFKAAIFVFCPKNKLHTLWRLLLWTSSVGV